MIKYFRGLKGIEKKNIVIYTNDPWIKFSGWREQTKNLINVLGDEINFTIFTFGGNGIHKQNDQVKDLYEGYQLRWQRFIVLWLYFLHVYQNRDNIDGVYLPKSHLTVLPLLTICSFFNFKIITRISGGELEKRNKFRFWIKKTLLRLSDKCVALNKEDFNVLKKSGIAAVYIPNAIDLNRYHPVKSSEERKNINICSFGSVCRRKKTDLALNVFNALIQNGVEANLTIIGPTNNFSEFEKEYVEHIYEKVNHLQLQERVTFTGEVSNPEKYLQYQDIIIFPSESEGMPNALLEAMACGCVPVANKIPGVKELIETGYNGFLINENDEKEYIKICMMLSENHKMLENISLNTASYINKNYNAVNVYRSYAQLFL